MKRGTLTQDPEIANRIAELLKALAHPLRIRMVALLCKGERHVNGLAEELGVKQAIISQQLRILRMRRLVEVVRKQGLSNYRLAEPRLRELVRCLETCSLH
jgi:DNA-binding transcriptional ArsR family regulator